MLAVVVVLLILLIVTVRCSSRSTTHPAQLAAFHILKEVRALSNNRASSYMSGAANFMKDMFPAKGMPSLEEARIIHRAFAGSIDALESSSETLSSSAISLAQKDGSGATAEMAGWMVQASASIRSIIGLIRILGEELPNP